MVPGDYTVGMNQLWDDSKKHTNSDPANLDVKVTVGWIKGMNRLYFFCMKPMIIIGIFHYPTYTTTYLKLS